MIKFDKNEFLKPQIYSTLDEYETRCNVTKEIIEEIEQLQQENKKLNGTIQTYDILLKANVEENKQLKDDWNYIKKMLKEARQEEFNINGYCGTCTDVDIDFLLNKMQELEQGSDNNE